MELREWQSAKPSHSAMAKKEAWDTKQYTNQSTFVVKAPTQDQSDPLLDKVPPSYFRNEVFEYLYNQIKDVRNKPDLANLSNAIYNSKLTERMKNLLYTMAETHVKNVRGGYKRRRTGRKSPKRKTPKRKTPKRKLSKRKTPKRKLSKRK